MKSTSWWVGLTLGWVAFAFAAGAETPGGRLADHVVLISIDGLRPEFYLDLTWPAPMMQQMKAEGAHAKRMRGVFPSVTYPSHTTLVTGALPARHGVYYNSPFEAAGKTGRWYWEYDAIRVPTLWSAARQAGLKTAAVNWPVTVGAPIDLNLPEVWSADRQGEPLDRMKQETRPAGLWGEIEREATGRLTAENFSIDHLTRDDRAGDIAAYLLEQHRPALLAVHLIEADHFQHELGREATMVRRALAAADRALAQTVEAAERAGILERTAFIVTGDHGFVDLHTRLAPNVWLAEAGLLEAPDGRGAWRAAFLTTGASGFLHLADPQDEAAVAEVRTLLENRPPAQRKLFRILDRQQLAELGAAPEAALALAPRPGVDLTDDATGADQRAQTGATHGYLMETPEIFTGFIGWGSGLRAHAVVHEMDQTDVAPLIAHLLGFELPAEDGALLLGILSGGE